MSYTAKDIVALRSKTSAGMALCKEALENADGDMEKAVVYINEKSDAVSRLHNMTGAKIGLCKIAFKDAEEDFEKALDLIEERGWASDPVDTVEKPKEGMIGSYVHGTDRKTVALIEVECVTDFVAKNEDFIQFANELAKQAAAMKPEYVSVDRIPEDKLSELKDLFKREALEEGKPENIVEKIIEGKLNKFYEEKCLLSQKWFKDDTKTMQSLLDDAIGRLGEPLKIGRLLVWEFGK
ncbi:elongation factor Ts [Candidatus Nomurabacteria bacterium]|uniref:Elongation factor Ts n=1 Tax=Candidatus Dojkabacteria bacterium TaxID=2099670 RepID=A0A955KWS7_9BACT|nr:elongation factor Ts [Candidatus Dojkabacteria bacterium]MCB9789765.1 elongation factor Ts [Candidatus Nomurabacteria bacterium]MCB9803862.1 elongation factor Ts [Candidatus Nomurabacteria bacterium]